jgi:hypothetical protein
MPTTATRLSSFKTRLPGDHYIYRESLLLTNIWPQTTSPAMTEHNLDDRYDAMAKQQQLGTATACAS